ncbi:peptide/nickel transport system permease protein [Nocardia amikacinitolerans]|uniref:ABC transporter permease n=1 Tax=Nocardia amikacinitolerans TaxID=756689 RepID=UPI000831EB25|nr:ABC transporter permease [Nocardia amikacinitolerans]MCP2316190.1 peptide/nickel transport system permease protein [Nocardia amikacinitolerans]
MTRYLLRRIGGGIGVLFVVALVVFGLFEALDSDAAAVALSRDGGRDPSPEQLAAVRAELGLDRPAPVRFLDWAGDFVRGDLGTSLVSGRPVGEVLLDRLGNSAVLAVVTTALLVPIALCLGLAAGARAGSRLDRAVSAVTLVAESLPSFVSGVILVATVALTFRLLPAVSLLPTGVSAWQRPEVLVLPVLCLLIGASPHPVRVIRAQTADVMTSPYIETARLNGVGPWRLLARHVAPNAVSASIHPLAGSIVGLIGGIAVVETLFAYPGLSQELLRAISARDFPFVQSAAMLMAGVGLVVYLIADLLTLAVSPRARHVVLGGQS